MSELIHECEHEVTAADGRTSGARVFGEKRGNLWVGWIEFTASDGRPAVRTDIETTQPDRDAIVYWASGLEPVYLEGALARAK